MRHNFATLRRDTWVNVDQKDVESEPASKKLLYNEWGVWNRYMSL